LKLLVKHKKSKVIPSTFKQYSGRISFIFYLHVITEMNSIKTRHTITISEYTFRKLRGVGLFGESYSDLILRLVESVNDKLGENIEK
jgi:hypothetical protein